MKKTIVFLPLLLVVALTLACSRLTDLVPGGNVITPSDTIITEERDVSGFTGIDMGTFGKVVITQGEDESLTIKGSDNVVPLVKTTVRGGVLSIEMDENINPLGVNNAEDVLSFTITVKDMSSLAVSGLADVEMGSLDLHADALDMSGAGHVQLSELAAQGVDITMSGLGGVEVAGEATHATINISGAGEVDAGDLECQTADVTISGLGTATVWVTDELTGNISGAGNVRYYGDPATNTESTGVGQFESLGSK
jgi:hypothetical protein